MKMLSQYFDRLKEAGIYDKTAIIVMGDHGTGRFISPLQTEKESVINSLLLYKNFDTTQDEIKTVEGIYPDVADISDLVLYSAGITNKKLNARYGDICKKILTERRKKNAEIIQNLQLHKERIKYDIFKSIPAGISSYQMHDRSVSITIYYKENIEQDNGYLVFENEKDSYILNLDKIYFYFDDKKNWYRVINFKADNVAEGEYDMKILVENSGKYYQYEIPYKKVVINKKMEFKK